VSTATKQRRRAAPVAHRSRRRSPLLLVVLAAGVVLAVVAALVASDGGTATRAGIEETRPVTATGAVPKIGDPAPELRGAAFDGTPVSITDDGAAKVVVFLAHWCSHCRNELPHLVGWLDEGVAAGADVYGVSTGTSKDLPNYPPSAWLEREGWDRATLADDAAGSAARAFGMPGTPYYVAIDASGRVVAADSGEIGRTRFAALVAAAKG
jgi:peroxiredoxin